MNIIREDFDALNANLKITVVPADYEAKVKQTLEKYRKTAKIPGFRPGKVPFGHIQKQYGASVLSEELNKAVSQALNGYITENKLEIRKPYSSRERWC
ncbi:MAG: trigger factor family protein [Crocinitomicaceae bacterium]|nr:trigger factor family protein [Crocinitomicaceae bacterium]